MSAFPGTGGPFPDGYATAEVGVFWDIDQCKIVDGSNASKTTQNIRKVLLDHGHCGKVSIRAYGDKKDHDFLSAGVEFTHFPAGEKHARHTKMLQDIITSWVSENPNPSTLMLILGDSSADFVSYIKFLTSVKNYRVHHVVPPPY